MVCRIDSTTFHHISADNGIDEFNPILKLVNFQISQKHFIFKSEHNRFFSPTTRILEAVLAFIHSSLFLTSIIFVPTIVRDDNFKPNIPASDKIIKVSPSLQNSKDLERKLQK